MKDITKALKLCLLVVMVWTPTLCSAGNPPLNTGLQLKTVCYEKASQQKNVDWNVCKTIVDSLEQGMVIGAGAVLLSDNPKSSMADRTARFRDIFKYCEPDNVTLEQKALVVSKYLGDHPEQLNIMYPLLMLSAMQAAWPCSTRSGLKNSQ